MPPPADPTMLYPFTFHPILKDRVWGGRHLETLYGKLLPPDQPIGESWEISDRPEGVSVVANGPLAGRDLRWLMENHKDELLGNASSQQDRFPLLIKILDAQDVLSVQVHPPAAVASQMGGEPKTEMWVIAQATPEAVLYAGLKRGTTREEFARRIQDGSVAECIHQIRVKEGDALFLPSGRIHAIGGGNVIFEIQQNSDTTYRVFDWNRAGLDGKPRDLHVEQSIASIDFQDFEPSLIKSIYSRNPNLKTRFLVDDPLFKVDASQAKRGLRFYIRSSAFQILGLIKGRLTLAYQDTELTLQPGQFALLPACLERVTVEAVKASEYLHIQPGS